MGADSVQRRVPAVLSGDVGEVGSSVDPRVGLEEEHLLGRLFRGRSSHPVGDRMGPTLIPNSVFLPYAYI